MICFVEQIILCEETYYHSEKGGDVNDKKLEISKLRMIIEMNLASSGFSRTLPELSRQEQSLQSNL